jgi:CarD family transcriptional regulator
MGCNQKFYIMKILGNGMKIMIPTDSAASVGLREVIPAAEIPRVYAILRNKNVTIDKQTWNKRYREYLEKIKTGSVFEIASVLRDLFILKIDKNLSFGERKMMDTAKNLLVKEISVASKSEETKIEQDLQTIFAMQ